MQLPFLQKKHYYSIFISIILLLCGILLLLTFNNDNKKGDATTQYTFTVSVNPESGLQTQVWFRVDSAGTYNFVTYPKSQGRGGLGLNFKLNYEYSRGSSWLKINFQGSKRETYDAPSSLKYNSASDNYSFTISYNATAFRFYFTNSKYTYDTSLYDVTMSTSGLSYSDPYYTFVNSSASLTFNVKPKYVCSAKFYTDKDLKTELRGLAGSNLPTLKYYSVPMNSSIKYSIESANPGYKFEGEWQSSKINYIFTNNQVIPYNTTSSFYARLTPIKYNVKWDLDGGRWVDNNNQPDTSYDYDDYIRLPNYTQVKRNAGEYISGWYVNGSSYTTEAGNSVSKLTTTAGREVTIKAKWDTIKVTADANGSTFEDLNGWTYSTASTCYKTGVDIYGNFPIPKNLEGKYCNGFKRNSSDKEVLKSGDEIGFSKTIKADWQKECYSINFDGNGGTINTVPSIQYSDHKYYYQDKIPIYPNQNSSGDATSLYVYRQGYKFVGFSNADGSTYYYKVSDNPSTLTISDLGDNGGQVSFYAQWTPINYTIEYNLNDQSTTGRSISPTPYSIPSQPATYDTEFSLAGIGGASCLGYHFLGWGRTKTGDLVSSSYGIHNLTDKDGDTVTLYALWEPNSYTIKFNGSGRTLKGGSMPGDRNLTYEDTLLMPGIESLGLIFIGWKGPSRYFYYDNASDYADSNNTYSVKSIVQGVEEEKVITLYAQWEDTWANDENWGEDLMPPQSFGYYEVSKPAHLGWIARQLQSGNTLAGVSFKQQGNIDLGDLPWLSEGLFEGEYNGNGYYILNIHTTDNKNVLPSNFEGLFAQTSGAVLQNIHILSGNLSGYACVGSIVGLAEDTIIRNCVNHANVSGNTYVGGIAGKKGESDSSSASATMSGCVNYGQVNSNGDMQYVGGIVGSIGDGCTIEACYVRANVIGRVWTGGIVGYAGSDALILSCAFVGFSRNGIVSENHGYTIDCLVDSTYLGAFFPDEYTNNCVVYLNGELQTEEPIEGDTNWTKINDKWIPSALVWIA